MRRRLELFFAGIFCTLVCAARGAVAQQSDFEPIADNSFLIEEAYNQEPGVVQHINAFVYNRETKRWDYTFTQEWPVFVQAHQFSYTLPVAHPAETGTESGIGDILLNYRYEALRDDRIAVAPRASLVLPSGDYDDGLGADSFGLQVNLPVSVRLSPRTTMHWNLGATMLPDARNAGHARESLTSFNYGASIVRHLAPTLDLLVEIAGASSEIVEDGGGTAREESFFVSPGARFALDFDSGLQIVPGLAFPVGFGPSEGEYGFIGYLSLEHPF